MNIWKDYFKIVVANNAADYTKRARGKHQCVIYIAV